MSILYEQYKLYDECEIYAYDKEIGITYQGVICKTDLQIALTLIIDRKTLT